MDQLNEEREEILRMVAEGTISAEDAQNLLDALDPDPPIAERWQPPQDEAVELPDMSEYRARWQTVFNKSIGVFIGSAGVFLLLRKRFGIVGTLLRLASIPVMLISGIVALASYWSRDGLWLLVRILSGGTQEMEISLPIPLPLHWLRMLVDMAHDTIPGEGVSDQLGAAAAYLDELDDNSQRDPFVVRVDDGDGNGVELYIG